MTRWLGALCSLLLLAAPAGAQTWTQVPVPPSTVYQPYLGGNQGIAKGQPGAAVSVCPRPVTLSARIFRSYSGIACHNGTCVSLGGGHAGHPGNDLDVYDARTRTWSLPSPAECPPPYNADGTPNSVWRQIKGGATGTQGFSPTGKPWVHHTYDLTTWDTKRGRLLFMSGNGLTAWTPGTNAWPLLAGRDKAKGEVAVASGGAPLYDADTDSLYIFVSDAGNGAARGIHRYTFAADGSVATKKFLHTWPSLANWGFAIKYITAVRGPGRTAYLMLTPVSPTTQTPPNRLFTYHLDNPTPASVVWDQTLIPGTPAYDALAKQSFQRWDRRAATGQLYFPVGQTDDQEQGVYIKTEATNAWTFTPTAGGRPAIARWTFAYDNLTDRFIGFDVGSLYCGVTDAACGGPAAPWELTFGAAPPPPPPPPPPPAATIDAFTAAPLAVVAGQPVVLTWATSNTTAVSLNGAAVAADGTVTVTPAVTTTYDLLAGGVGQRLTVTVTLAPPPPPPPSDLLEFSIGGKKYRLELAP